MTSRPALGDRRHTPVLAAGHPGVIYSGKVDTAWNMGDRLGAESASRSARLFGLSAVIVAVVLFVLVIIWVIVVLAFVADTVHNLPTFTVTNRPS
ncbi:MAG: hypothetical protein DLM58_10630 [Pseudonocardiales bacterium]|nr:MAG: hypothetical protein DLM58_10630 [Pseudonocardiales bacterium]